MTREEKYDLVNGCETLVHLSGAILMLCNVHGDILGRTKHFDGERMSQCCLDFEELKPEVLTREFGIRQQAMYILHYTK
jgi:hypothetical protein